MVKIIVCAMVKNEVENDKITRTLDSLGDFIDGVVIIDTESTDDTVNVC